MLVLALFNVHLNRKRVLGRGGWLKRVFTKGVATALMQRKIRAKYANQPPHNHLIANSYQYNKTRLLFNNYTKVLKQRKNNMIRVQQQYASESCLLNQSFCIYFFFSMRIFVMMISLPTDAALCTVFFFPYECHIFNRYFL